MVRDQSLTDIVSGLKKDLDGFKSSQFASSPGGVRTYIAVPAPAVGTYFEDTIPAYGVGRFDGSVYFKYQKAPFVNISVYAWSDSVDDANEIPYSSINPIYVNDVSLSSPDIDYGSIGEQRVDFHFLMINRSASIKTVYYLFVMIGTDEATSYNYTWTN